ncbi:hypothetical protein [Dokdonia sp.]|uniref:hypothetical protein n=1 Tax=Dokdonia sp. TaxID=2024995 RepID=UPI0032677DE8
MKLFIIIIIMNSFSMIGQELEGTWLYDDQSSFISKNDHLVTSDIFDFFGDYSTENDTLKIKHRYPKYECMTTENGKTVVIPCPYDSIPNSWFKITKLTSDSLYLNPINRSAIAISARLKNRFIDQSKTIISDSSFTPDYFKTIKLYNANTLIEKINWSKIRVSWKSNGWFQEYYNYLEIYQDGTFKILKKVNPLKKENTSEENTQETNYYKGSLTKTEQIQLKKDVNASGIFRFKIDNIGLSSHGTLIKIKVFANNKRQTPVGYSYKYPTSALPMIKFLSSIVTTETNKQLTKPFKTPRKF